MDIKLIDPRFNPIEFQPKTLSIQVNRDGCCFCIKKEDPPQDILSLYIYSWIEESPESGKMRFPEERLEKILFEEPILQTEFTRQTWCVPETPSVLIPNDLYLPEEISKYGEKAFGMHHMEEEYQIDHLSVPEACHLYSLPVKTRHLLQNTFPSLEIYHPLTPWIEHILKTPRDNQSTLFFLNLGETHATLAVTEKGELQFFNWFTYSNHEELLYFLFSVAGIFDKKPENISLEIYPANHTESSYKSFSNYFPTQIIKTKVPDFLEGQNLQPLLHLLKNYP